MVAMGKLVSSLTMVTEEPYSKYPGLFEGLVKVRRFSLFVSISLPLSLSLSLLFLPLHLSLSHSISLTLSLCVFPILNLFVC